MKLIDNKSKIDAIRKCYKKESLFLEMAFFNYEGYDIYMNLTYNKKLDIYRLRWFNLAHVIDNKIDKYVSYSYIPNEVIKLIKDDFANFNVSLQYDDVVEFDNDVVVLYANIKTKVDKNINVRFKRYLPKSLECLIDLFIFIFRNISKDYEPFFHEIMAIFTDRTKSYEYKKEINFDLFNDNLDDIFEKHIAIRGKDYYTGGSVKFLEKVEDKYYAVVEGTQKYLVIVWYDDKKKKTQVYCSCPCEFYCKHIYAVILAIRNNDFNKFYKISYKNPSKTLLERIMEFNYALCLGIVDDKFEIVNNSGSLELIPILDAIGQYNWEILEDSEDKTLSKQIKKFLDSSEFGLK